jgi:hypothetical protein
MGKHLKILILAVFYSSLAIGQTEIRLILYPESFLKINGSTNINKFTLTLPGESFPGREYKFQPTFTDNTVSISENGLSLDVKNFKSDDHIALNGFKKLVKADRYPHLNIELVKIYLSPDCLVKKEEGVYRGNALVNITITGVTKQYELPFSASLDSDTFSASGKLKVTMKDFGLIPPVEMFGLIKTSEWLEIDLNIAASLTK